MQAMIPGRRPSVVVADNDDPTALATPEATIAKVMTEAIMLDPPLLLGDGGCDDEWGPPATEGPSP